MDDVVLTNGGVLFTHGRGRVFARFCARAPVGSFRQIDAQRRSWHLGATLFTAFGGLAWVVAAVGLYGVTSYNVGQRKHEIGVRIALGARRHDVVRVVLGQGLRFAMAGVILGAALALAASPWIEPLLFPQSPRDPAPFATAGLILLVTALVACALPALKASRTDPNVVLRGE